jgi:hypothetical protein
LAAESREEDKGEEIKQESSLLDRLIKEYDLEEVFKNSMFRVRDSEASQSFRGKEGLHKGDTLDDFRESFASLGSNWLSTLQQQETVMHMPQQ